MLAIFRVVTILLNILGVLTCGAYGQTKTARARGTLRNLSLPMRQNVRSCRFVTWEYKHNNTASVIVCWNHVKFSWSVDCSNTLIRVQQKMRFPLAAFLLTIHAKNG